MLSVWERGQSGELVRPEEGSGLTLAVHTEAAAQAARNANMPSSFMSECQGLSCSPFEGGGLLIDGRA